MNRNVWRVALTLVCLSALGSTGWSLAEVAAHYEAPWPVGAAAVVVFDGAAYACLYFANEASAAGRSAAGARLASLCQAAGSVYLNGIHADLIHGGGGAAILFSSPTIALLVVSELSWAGPRAQQRGEQPFRFPLLGGWAWIIAPRRAGKSVKARAIDYIEQAGQPVRTAPERPATAMARLREHFATLDPTDSIRIGHEAQPDLAPGDLAALLRTYGVNVDAVQVALVLLGAPAEIAVDRPDTKRTAPGDTPTSAPSADPRIELTKADMLSGPRPDNITAAVRDLVRRGITDRDPVVSITRDLLGTDINPDTIRRTLAREIDRAGQATNVDVGKGGGGYA
ncbi:hypothetical protein [Streptomyces sp. x-80]|uniref:hypothetical protein n=1 Tax=Streptomyces sp. x-80 TaxID=2789282 RepID=UPI00397F086E